MRTALCSALALGACTAVAFAGPPPPAAGANDSATAETHVPGPVTLTETEMDSIAAGGAYSFDVKIEGKNAGRDQNVATFAAAGTATPFFRLADHNSPLAPD